MPVSVSGSGWSMRERAAWRAKRIAYRARVAELAQRREAKQAVAALEVFDLRSRGGVTPHITPRFIEDGLPTRRVGDLETSE